VFKKPAFALALWLKNPLFFLLPAAVAGATCGATIAWLEPAHEKAGPA
jgi:hypothetical protein